MQDCWPEIRRRVTFHLVYPTSHRADLSTAKGRLTYRSCEHLRAMIHDYGSDDSANYKVLLSILMLTCKLYFRVTFRTLTMCCETWRAVVPQPVMFFSLMWTSCPVWKFATSLMHLHSASHCLTTTQKWCLSSPSSKSKRDWSVQTTRMSWWQRVETIPSDPFTIR